MTQSKIEEIQKQLSCLTLKSLDVTNLKTDYFAYKENDIVNTKKLDNKIELLNNQILAILSSQTTIKGQLELLQKDLEKMHSELFS